MQLHYELLLGQRSGSDVCSALRANVECSCLGELLAGCLLLAFLLPVKYGKFYYLVELFYLILLGEKCIQNVNHIQ